MFISSYVGFYYGLCDLNLLLESTHTRNWYLQTMTGSFLQIPFNENPMFIIAVFEVLPQYTDPAYFYDHASVYYHQESQ